MYKHAPRSRLTSPLRHCKSSWGVGCAQCKRSVPLLLCHLSFGVMCVSFGKKFLNFSLAEKMWKNNIWQLWEGGRCAKYGAHWSQIAASLLCTQSWHVYGCVWRGWTCNRWFAYVTLSSCLLQTSFLNVDFHHWTAFVALLSVDALFPATPNGTNKQERKWIDKHKWYFLFRKCFSF